MKYIDDLTEVLQNLDTFVFKRLVREIRDCSGIIYTMGNGGSATTASHFTCDLNKFTNKTAICLNDSISQMTAISNDRDYSLVFTEQLKKFKLDKNDIILTFTGSGMSENIISALKYGEIKETKRWAITGFKGGFVKSMASSLIVNSDDMQIIEDTHLVISHMIMREIRESI